VIFGRVTLLMVGGLCLIMDVISSEIPTDYKDRSKRDFGSLLPHPLFGQKNNSNGVEDEHAQGFRPKPSECHSSQKEKVFDACLNALTGFSMDVVDKSGATFIIKTAKTQVDGFDGTGCCYYVVLVEIQENGNFSVTISSKEDSPCRLSGLQQLVRKKITDLLVE
jgi:hypothetical protein